MRGGERRSGGAIRAFLALEIPAAIREDLAQHVASLRRQLEPARWVRPGALHLTLRFLGESAPEGLDELVERLRPVLAPLAPVTVRLAGAGFFPGPRRPRVAWIGGEAPDAAEVAAAIDDAAHHLGWNRERRPFALHLTLARLKSPWSTGSVDRWLEWGRGYAAAPFVCREVILFESRLAPGGAVYTPLHQLPLGGPAGR